MVWRKGSSFGIQVELVFDGGSRVSFESIVEGGSLDFRLPTIRLPDRRSVPDGGGALRGDRMRIA
jgi:hypothetical protein